MGNKIIGIYKILNKINGKYYIGSSNNILRRWNSHKSVLRRNCHENIHLQRAWNKYGENNFEMDIIETVDWKILLEKEQRYLDVESDNPINCYNTNFISNRPPMNDEIRQKISISMRGKVPWNKGKTGLQIAWNKGVVGIHADTSMKMSVKAKLRKGKLNPNYSMNEYIFINVLTGEDFVGTQNAFRYKYNLPQSSVSRLISGKYKFCKNWTMNKKQILHG